MAQSIGNAIGMIGSIKKNKEGREMQRKAQNKIDHFSWDSNNLTPSTMGGDIRREAASLNTATSIDALRSGGTRAVMGGTGKVMSTENQVNREVAADIDRQQKTIDMYNAQVNDRRQANELAGYGQMLNTGMGMKYQGIADMQATGQAQGQHNMEIMQMIMGGSGGGMGGGA